MTTPLPPKQFTTVDGHRLAHVEMGQGGPIVLLHGNPTSSYLWRDVVPPLAGLGRMIAPDLIGHGDSDKLPASLGPGRYTLEGTYELLAAQLAALIGDQRVTLVLHDWGSALGFHWARLHPQRQRGIADSAGVGADRSCIGRFNKCFLSSRVLSAHPVASRPGRALYGGYHALARGER